jgi:uncharacterized membrane protein (UPF0182 family)
MSDFFADDAEPPARPVPPRPERRRPRPLVLTLIVMAVLIVAFSLFASVWTEKLWFGSVGYGDVFSKLVWTKIGLFAFFGAVMALVVGGNLWIAFRLRPMFRANSPEQANLDRYREVITPIRRILVLAASAVFGIFAGASATGQWRSYLLWANGQSFGQKDPYFHKDIGFYVFTLPWLHWLVDFTMTALVLGLLAGVFVHYVYGGIRLQARAGRVSGPAQAQISVMLGLLVLLKGVDYYLDRFDLNTANGGLVTGMTYSRQHAMLPSKNILMAIALVCAVLFFANVFRRTWTLSGMGLALFALSAIVLGVIWPATVQKFQVKPDEPDKESTYIANNIAATRDAFQLPGDDPIGYEASTNLNTREVETSKTIPYVRLLDPLVVRDAFNQLQQQKGYYTVGGVLDVDRYKVDATERDMVVAAREINLAGLPLGQKKWANEHTVYTHGYGMIAAYGNQRDEQGNEVVGDGTPPSWAEQDLPPKGVLTGPDGKPGYRDQVYYGENSPSYSIVGKKPGGNDVELDVPQGSGAAGDAKTSTYTGKGGVKIGSMFDRLLYSVKFGDPNLVLSSRVNSSSKILYDRSPREEVQKVAPWLTVDSDALPSVVDGKIVWILDGYTTTDRYPLAEKRSLTEMTSDSISPRSAYATLPTDQINYMRNAVKATVDAYDGTVTLYEWDQGDPILQAWERAFPGVVKSRDSIPPALLAHFRYPEDLFKVQRNLFADYHVDSPKTFYEGSDKWDVPEDPDHAANTQPPYRLSVAPVKQQDPGSPDPDPVFSLTSVYTPTNKQNLASYFSVVADAASPDYGKFTVLRMPATSNTYGPTQMANQFSNATKVATALKNYKGNTDAVVVPGNLLTLPVDGGFLYVQPLYTTRSTGGSGKYPVLQFVLASYGGSGGNDVGMGPSLTKALNNIGKAQADTSNVGGPTDTVDTPGSTGTPGTSGTPSGPALSAQALVLLRQANREFRLADQALAAQDLSSYATHVKAGQRLVQQAIAASAKADRKSATKSGATRTKKG